LSSPPNEFEERLARDFPEPAGAFAVEPIAKRWASHIDARVPHVVWVNGQPVGLVHVEVAVSLARFRESHRLLNAVLDVMGRVKLEHEASKQWLSLAGTAIEDALEELFAAGRHVSQHLTETDTALTVAGLEAKNEQPYHAMPKTEPH
jgi:hypothetical protein